MSEIVHIEKDGKTYIEVSDSALWRLRLLAHKAECRYENPDDINSEFKRLVGIELDDSPEQVFPFGKHKGESVRSVILDDVSYVNWCIDNAGFVLDHRLVDLYNDKWSEYKRDRRRRREDMLAYCKKHGYPKDYEESMDDYEERTLGADSADFYY